MDNDFRDGRVNGFELAKYLHELGYSNLYIISGKDFGEEGVPSYLKVLIKGNMSDLTALVADHRSLRKS
jgi:hypothetical protein